MTKVWVVYSVLSSRGDERQEMIGVYPTKRKAKDAAWATFYNNPASGATKNEGEFALTAGPNNEIGYGSDEFFVYYTSTKFYE